MRFQYFKFSVIFVNYSPNSNCMKHVYLLFILITTFSAAQQMRVVDVENGNAISNARLIVGEKVVYSNDDGYAIVGKDEVNIRISAIGYQSESLKIYQDIVRLKPAIKEIQEVKIVKIDVKPIFEEVLRNFSKIYYPKPSLYDVDFKQKSFDNNKLNFLVISNGKIWTKSNSFNFKDAIRNKENEIMQFQFDGVKLLRNIKSDSIFSGKTNEPSQEKFGNFFINFELIRIIKLMQENQTKYSGTLLSEDQDEQLISFKTNSYLGVKLEGEMRFNKKDRAITYLSVTHLQEEYPIVKRKTTDGENYDFKLGDATITFEFYKKDRYYIPSFNKIEGSGFTVFYKNETHVKKFSREIIYKSFSASTKSGLDSINDFDGSYWDGIPVKDNKETTVLLSKEEQDFINQK